MRNFYRPRPVRKYYTINFRITATNLRVVDDQSKFIGLLTKEVALRMAEEKGLDLVLIAPNAKPPVAKIIDFKKFLYQTEKKEKEAKKGIKKSIVKDLKVSLFIAVADLERMVKKGKLFLNDGNQVRLNLTLKGREIGKKQMAFDLLKKFIGLLGEVNVSKEPRLEGRVIRAVISKRK